VGNSGKSFSDFDITELNSYKLSTFPPLSHQFPTHFAGKLGKFPDFPEFPTFPKRFIDKLHNKEKIILSIFNTPKSMAEICEDTNLGIMKVSRTIQRSDRDSGLLNDDLVEKMAIDDKDHYIATTTGKEHIKILLEEYEGKEKLEEVRWRKDADILHRVNAFKEFIENEYNDELLENVRNGKKVLIIDFTKLCKFSPELSDQLLEEGEEVLKTAEMAIENIPLPTDSEKIAVRIMNLPGSQEVRIRDIRSKHIGKLLWFEGVVRQKSSVRPHVTSSRFECPSCGNVITILQLDTKFKEPSRCGCGRKGKFRLLTKELVDAQSLTLEESTEDMDGGDQPKRIKIFLKDDLVSPLTEKRTNPGNTIIVIGTVKEVPIILRTGGQSTRFDLLIEGNYVESVQEEFSEVQISLEEREEIKKISKAPDLMKNLIASIAPAIYGHERIKEALMLQLVGGVKKYEEDGTTTRGDSHILLVGDPGSGKSKLLKRINKVAPKSRFVSGKGASGAGISAAVVKDEFIGGWALEAGALVLANKGILCLDELDKMSKEDTSAMHEALEGQLITISKANIQATLRCETTVLSAANPKFGRFDPFSKTLAEQIELPSTLINRFDLIFAIKDVPDEEKDRNLAKFVLGKHRDSASTDENRKKLVPEAPISTDLLRKFIAYVRQTKPQINDAAADTIVNYYLKMRRAGNKESKMAPIPISARQIEATVRMSEAYAKIRLSSRVTRNDAEKATELLDYCLRQIAFDEESGTVDIDRIATGVSASKRSRFSIIKSIIEELEEKLGKKIPIEDVVARASEEGIPEEEVEEAINALKKMKDIYEPRSGFVSRL